VALVNPHLLGEEGPLPCGVGVAFKVAWALAGSLRSSPVLGQILLNRGLTDEEAARAFLEPSLNSLAEPAGLPGIDRAVERILAAVRAGEEIVVFGDYDVDGISGTALLTGFLEVLGAKVRPHLPNRLADGYGLSEDAVERLVESGAGLLVTVDHGTTAVAEIDFAAAKGLDTVVVDHHTPGEPLPAAVALVNPHLLGEEGPLPCGVGVAFKVAWALASRTSTGTISPTPWRSWLSERSRTSCRSSGRTGCSRASGSGCCRRAPARG
jgi:single-stranded-DNA-specific exonuclease